MQRTTEIVVESTARRAFAGAIEWPGWCRGARTGDLAVVALAAYGTRYADVARRAGIAFIPPGGPEAFDIVERLTGGAGTDYGVPSVPPAADQRLLDDAEFIRLEALLRATWETFAEMADRAVGVSLRLGPRGGGRDLEKIREHVRMSEEAYLTQLGARPPGGAGAGAGAIVTPLRAAMLATLEARARDTPIENPSGTKKRWPPRYAVRRTAWHALDHAWEIEDRMAPVGA